MLYAFDKASPLSSLRIPVQSPASLGIVEKDIENFFAAHIHQLIPEDQLMLIGQERPMQEEADLLALDRRGNLFIFELKRWQSSPENLLQVMRYGQIFGRYDYRALETLAQRQLKLEGKLSDKHQKHFSLESPLPEASFNRDQVFVVVTNGADHDTLEAIKYWKGRGVRIESLTYKLYSINNATHLWFDVYNPELDVVIEENPGTYCVNTNATFMETAWKHMLANNRASAFYVRKYAVTGIPKGSTIYLYHTGTGIIAKGKTTGTHGVS